MPNIFIISDIHFGHKNTCLFKGPDGVTPLRPWDDPAEMDEALVENWNKVVKPHDMVYHLGDVAMNRRHLATVSRLNGSIRLVLGNHDIFDHADYLPYFKRLHGSHKIDDLLLTHIPVHIDSISHWVRCNVHGHIHGQDIPHGKYFNACVENINYTPIALEDLRIRIKEKATKYNVDLGATDANVTSANKEMVE